MLEEFSKKKKKIFLTLSPKFYKLCAPNVSLTFSSKPTAYFQRHIHCRAFYGNTPFPGTKICIPYLLL